MLLNASIQAVLRSWHEWLSNAYERNSPSVLWKKRRVRKSAVSIAATSILLVYIFIRISSKPVDEVPKIPRRYFLEQETWRDSTSSCPDINVSVLLKYEVHGGTINQYLSHLSAFIFAKELGAQILLSNGVYRESIGVHYKNTTWRPMPAREILNVPLIRAAWAAEGVRVHVTVPPELRAAAFPHQNEPDPQLYVKHGHGTNSTLDDIFQGSCAAIKRHLNRFPEDPREDGGPRRVVLDLGNCLLMLRTAEDDGLARRALRRLPFAEKLHDLAETAVTRARAAGLAPFNGVHLRAEGDARIWAGHFGQGTAGPPGLRRAYREFMEAAGFGHDTPVYVATGLLDADPGDDWRAACEEALYPASRRVVHKGVLLRREELAGLNLEQLSVIDLLVLLSAERYVGFSLSTFSILISEIRTLTGIDPSRSSLVFAERMRGHFDGIAPMVTFSEHLKLRRPIATVAAA